MTVRTGVGAVLLAVLCLAARGAGGQAVPPLPLLNGSSTDALAGTLRGYLVAHIPPVLLEESHNWGNQKLVTRGLEWKGKGKLGLQPQRQKAHKNDGVWRKVRVATGSLPDTLVFDLRDVQKPAPDRMTFTTFLSLDARVDYDQQNWRAGLRTYAGSVRARMRVKVALFCEVTTRVEKTGNLLPDVVFRGRVLKADLRYDNFVVEHVGGVGGELAKLIGGAAHAAIDQWRPSLERKLLEKANAAIVKAGDTKDVRIGLGKFFE